MSIELDHLFVCARRNAPEADELVRFGLREGAPNQHPGQGTANRRFFFHNAFLELVWVEDPAETQSALVARTGLWERWADRQLGASPFGVGLRFAEAGVGALPFSTWAYRPPYLPAQLAILMAEHSQDATAPLLFALSFGRRADAFPPQRRQPLDHRAGLREITRVRIAVPELNADIAAAWQNVQQACPEIEVTAGDEHLLEIGFDQERRGQSHDFRSELPIVFKW